MRPTLTLTILALAATAPHALGPAPAGATAIAPAQAAPIRAATASPAEDAWLGVSIGAAENGVVVTSVKGGGPAERAGLRDGDVLLEFDGYELDEPAELVELVRSHSAGEAAHLRFARGDREFERMVTLGARDTASTQGSARSRPAPAIAPAPEPPVRRPATAPVPDQGRGWLGVSLARDGGAVTIQDVRAGSPAEAGGLRAGDRVLALDGHQLSGPAELADLVGAQSPGDRVQMRLSREGRELRLLLELGERPTDVSGATSSARAGRGNWQAALDRLLQREIGLLQDERDEERRFAREAARQFQQRERGPAEDLLDLLREHDGEAVGELREIAGQFRDERLAAFAEFRERLNDIEQERREQLIEWRERIAERSQETRPARGPRLSGPSDASEVEALRRQVEELRARIEELRHAGGAR